MNIRTNTGSDRKLLVKTLSELLNEKPRYRGAPTFVYEFDALTIDREGTLTLAPTLHGQAAQRLADVLEQRGFTCTLEDAPESSEIEQTTTAEIGPEESDEHHFTVRIDSARLGAGALDRLKNLVESKHLLICKVLNADDLPIRAEDDGATLAFPWFEIESNDVEREAYQMFIDRLVELSNQIKRARLSDRVFDNEKYAFRCFLLRLGFIGTEFKAQRKVLMRNLEGNSAFCCGYDPRRKLRNEVSGLPMVIQPSAFESWLQSAAQPA